MSDVQFDSDTNSASQNNPRRKIMYSHFETSSTAPTAVLFLIKKKIVRNERQAMLVLLAGIVICIVTAYILFRSTGSSVPFSPDQALNSLSQRNNY